MFVMHGANGTETRPRLVETAIGAKDCEAEVEGSA
eukprot:COSAG02_NODE_777_length_17301_cov_8.632310_17_plen_35_part_00